MDPTDAPMDTSPVLRLLEWLLTPSLPVIALALAVVLLVPVLLHAYLARQTAYVTLPAVVVAGPSGAGKTALVTYLERGGRTPNAEKTEKPGPVPTHTSQTPAVVELAVAADRRSSSFRDDLDAAGAMATKFLLVDTPGHGKLRGPTLRWLATTGTKAAKSADAVVDGPVKAVVFVVDAAALDGDGLADTAAYLYDLLLALQQRAAAGSRSARPPPALPVLVAANKADLFTAMPASRVRARLEAELGRVRARRSRGLLDSRVGADDAAAGADLAAADDADAAQWLGAYGSAAFSFAELRESDTEVAVEGGSLVDGSGVDAWWAWMAEHL